MFVPETDASAGSIGRAERIVSAHVPSSRIERLVFAMRDADARAGNWDRAGEAIAAVLRRDETAAFATIGDPNLYSTFTYIANTVRTLVPDVEVRTVPGITAMQDLAARTGIVLAEGAEPVVLMPYTAGDEVLREALDRGDTVVVYKGGRHLPRLARRGQGVGPDRRRRVRRGARLPAAGRRPRGHPRRRWSRTCRP